MDRILVVEDTRLFANILKKELAALGDLEPVVAESYRQAQQLLEERAGDFFVAVLDLNLPDAPQGEIVDLVIQAGVPPIVFTGEFSDELRERMVTKRVVDYILKESASSIQYVVALVNRVSRNRRIQVLVVDDSRSARSMVSEMLKIHLYQVLEAENGLQALEMLEQHRAIRMVITDYNMPGMDGFELTRRIRQRYDKNQLAIIGLSSYGNNILSARFIKHGANDFINKPFLPEEFFVRITQNIEIIEFIHALQERAVRDFLTGLPNRRYFMDEAVRLHASARRGQISLTIGVMDVDFFKKVNDTYGHEAGDEVLKKVAATLRALCRDTDLVARIGGEEFAVLLVNMDQQAAGAFFERLRQAVASLTIPCRDGMVQVTISIGGSCILASTVNDMLDQADRKLYEAKHAGRNRVVLCGKMIEENTSG